MRTTQKLVCQGWLQLVAAIPPTVHKYFLIMLNFKRLINWTTKVFTNRKFTGTSLKANGAGLSIRPVKHRKGFGIPLLMAISSASLSFVSSESEGESNKCINCMPVYRRSDVLKHNGTSAKDMWVTCDNGVYDVTDFIANHPGRKENLMLAAGQDLNQYWKLLSLRYHYKSPLDKVKLEGYRIGSLHPDDVIDIDVNELAKDD